MSKSHIFVPALLSIALLAVSPMLDTPSGDPAFGAKAQQAKATEKKTRKKRDPGQRLYMRKTCMACHGRGGALSIQDYPNLAGQPEKYLFDQTLDIISKRRVGGTDKTGAMRTQPMLGALISPDGKVRITTDEIRQIVKWLSQQPPAKPRPIETPLTEAQSRDAKALYDLKCKNCHGRDALHPLANYPMIAGQRREYIIGQMNDVKNKIRNNRRIDSMYSSVKTMTDEEIDLLASWLSQIDRTQ